MTPSLVKIKILRDKYRQKGYFKINGKSIKNIDDILMQRFLDYLNVIFLRNLKDLKN